MALAKWADCKGIGILIIRFRVVHVTEVAEFAVCTSKLLGKLIR